MCFGAKKKQTKGINRIAKNQLEGREQLMATAWNSSTDEALLLSTSDVWD